MDSFSAKILKELLPAEREVVPPAARRTGPPNPVDHWSAALLKERADYLSKMAKHGNGSAGETLREFPQHCAVLSYRSRDGEAEVHENFADIFYVLEGRATLVTGGTVAGARIVGPGETRGTSVEGGTRQLLRVGDVAHVPAGISHQMLVSSEQPFTALIVKVQEKP
jgi:mannose-6-phosphate isomerase-like protein (cupin superfamily)